MNVIKKYILIPTSILLVLLGLCFFVYKTEDIPLEILKEKYTNEHSRFIEVEGINVHYRDEGNLMDSTPIILVHGTSSSLHTFDDWTKDLKASKRVIRLDLPGFGLTGPFENTDYRLDHYVDFLHTFLSALNVNDCVLAGNSIGGNIVWLYALKHPEQVKGMVLIDAGGYNYTSQKVPLAFTIARWPIANILLRYITPKSIAQKSITNVYADPSKVTSELIDRYYELTLRPGNRKAMVDRLTTQLDTSYITKIPIIVTPALILWGKDDMLIPVQCGYTFAADLQNSKLVVLENCGHVPMEECPKESFLPLKEFLISLPTQYRD